MATDVKPEVTAPKVRLIESDGEPLESHWHVFQIQLLLDSIAYHFRDRNDYYAGGNMFIYYSVEQARTRRYRGPDFFFVEGINRLPMRRYWCVWQEDGRYPDLIIELLSPTTAKADRTTKKDLYQRVFKTHEYFCYDPDEQVLEGWRLGEGQHYRSIRPNNRGWMWIEGLKLWLGVWEGEYKGYNQPWLRFYDADGKLVSIWGEAAEAEAARLRKRLEELEKRPKRGRRKRP
jgi:Uma2 family endonuclease